MIFGTSTPERCPPTSGSSFTSDQGWALPTAFNVGPAFLALAIVGPIAKFVDLRRAPQGKSRAL
jgi:hypothetical protein